MVIADVLYTFAGEHSPRVPVDNDVYALDLKGHAWHRIPATSSSPVARVGHAGASLGSLFYVYGGRTGAQFAEHSLADLHAFDPSTSTWTPVAISSSSSNPPPLSYHSLISSSTCLYLFGGCTPDHGRSNALYSFDPSTSTWTLLSHNHPNGPPPCGGATAVHVRGSIHVLFGYDGKEELQQHFAFDLTTKDWTRVGSGKEGGMQPDARSVTDAVWLEKVGGVWAWGGEYTPSAQGHEGAGSYHGGRGWVFDVKEGQWRQAEGEGPSARGWFNSCAGSDGASVVVFGGFDGNRRLNDTWMWHADAEEEEAKGA